MIDANVEREASRMAEDIAANHRCPAVVYNALLIIAMKQREADIEKLKTVLNAVMVDTREKAEIITRMEKD